MELLLLVSSLTDIPLPRETCVFGEVSLSGAIRPVPQSDARLKEAEKLGFSRALAPAAVKARDMQLNGFAGLDDFVRWVRKAA